MITAEFRGKARVAPLTWGQQDIWRAVTAAGPEHGYLNFTRVLDTPRRTDVTVEQATAALGMLISAHEALRTRLTASGSQRVEASGRLPIGDLDEGAFDYEKDWPLRASFVMDGDRVRQIVLVFCHLAVDGHGADIVTRDLRLLLLRGTPPRPTTQPADLAAWQHSDEGRRTASRAVAFWTAEHKRISPGVTPSAEPRSPRFLEARLRSDALDAAGRAIATRHRVSSSTVYLATAIALSGALTGRSVCGMRPIVSNRFHRDRRDMVSTVSQEGLVVLDLDVPTFGDLVRQCWTVALKAYRHAQFDPYEMERVAGDAGFGCFNDLRLIHRDSPGEPPSRERRTAVEWPSTMDHNVCDFRVHIEEGEVSLHADTALLPPSGIEGYLRSYEDLLVEAALRDVPMAELL